jgi:hypothetical protein
MLAYEDLLVLAASLFQTLPRAYHLTYKDDEGDDITVTNDMELQEAYRLFNGKVPKFCIVPSVNDLSKSLFERWFESKII